MSSKDEVKLLSGRWIIYSALGMLMLSAGLIIFMFGIESRIKGHEATEWAVIIGVAIILFNAGIAFLGSSIKYRIYLDRKRKHDSEFKTTRSSESGRRRSSSRSSG